MTVSAKVRYAMMKKKAGSVKQIKDVHIFERGWNGLNCTSTSTKSMCGKISLGDVDFEVKSTCLGESDMRMRAAEIGREVCGQCVAKLYADND